MFTVFDLPERASNQPIPLPLLYYLFSEYLNIYRWWVVMMVVSAVWLRHSWKMDKERWYQCQMLKSLAHTLLVSNKPGLWGQTNQTPRLCKSSLCGHFFYTPTILLNIYAEAAYLLDTIDCDNCTHYPIVICTWFANVPTLSFLLLFPLWPGEKGNAFFAVCRRW